MRVNRYSGSPEKGSLMKLTRRPTLAAASIAAMVAVLGTGVQPASAQNLLEFLFGQNQRGRVVHEAPPVQPAPPPAPPRVTGPSYYTYKTDALVRVDFSTIRPERTDDEAMIGPIDRTSVGSTDERAVDVASAVTLEQPEPVRSDAVEDAPGMPVDPVAAPKPETAVEEQTAGMRQPLTDEQIAALQGFELLAEKEAAEAIVAHYSQAPEFLWVEDGQVNDAARAAMRTFEAAASHGLDPRDYAVSQPAGADDATLARFEMELSARALRYARDAQSGRIDPNRISGYHDFAPKEFDGVAVLVALGQAEDTSSYLEGFHPQNARYEALRVELGELRKAAENDIVVASDTLIRPGQTNGEFPKILTLIDRQADEGFRAEFGEVLARNLGTEVYGQELVPVIKAAQRMAGVGDDGVIGPRTVQAIAGDSKAARIDKVEVALEQLRWLPSDLGDRHVFINTPAFNASYIENGSEKLSMRTVVGGLSTQTYFFQDEIEYVEFHPYWGVPRSILVNKYLPKLYSDPSYLDRNGFEVTDRRGRAVSSSAVNWAQYGANIPFDVRQKPGRGNALGEMKIMFPNRHAIYMHDTPDRHLFDRDNRALSNGCIRLADPRAMAAAVLGWDREAVTARLDRPHSRENLSAKVPVYVAYFTAWPDEAGKVEYVNDVYSRDEKVLAAIEKVDALRDSGV